jgi:hypothetical protein
LDETGWVIERYVNSELRYWCGHRADDFRPLYDDAIRFAREIDANIVLSRLCDGQGRVAEHKWISPPKPISTNAETGLSGETRSK